MAWVWAPQPSRKEMAMLDAWWAEELARKMARDTWPPVWKPAKRNRRWRK